VLLDGQGGDEAFLGYHFLLYPSVYFTLSRRGRVLEAARELAWRRRTNGIPVRRSASEILRVALPHRVRGRRHPSWINPELAIPPRPLPPRTLRGHQLFGLMASPLPMYLHHEDRNSMSFSLEGRNPFLDYRIVELGLALDPRDLVQRGLSKWIVREAMRGILPSAIVDRPDKQGFATDEAEWLSRGALGSEMEAVFRSEIFATRPYFRSEAVLAMLAAHRAGQESAFALWRAFAMERWLRRFIDPPVFQPPAKPSPRVGARDKVSRTDEPSVISTEHRLGPSSSRTEGA
jgi:asparagine synthase (glutamine-hydrolysing)